MTQQQLGDTIGVSQKTIDSWEHDRHYPKSSIGALEAVLGISLSQPEEPRPFRPIPAHLRREIEQTLAGDREAQARVIGLLEGTLTWPDDAQEPPESGEQRAG
jgi:transcriptional regulator with XRE-family HTH domain